MVQKTQDIPETPRQHLSYLTKPGILRHGPVVNKLFLNITVRTEQRKSLRKRLNGWRVMETFKHMEGSIGKEGMPLIVQEKTNNNQKKNYILPELVLLVLKYEQENKK